MVNLTQHSHYTGSGSLHCKVQILYEEAFGMDCARLLLCRGGGTIVDARQRVWLVDGRGVITRSRADAEALPDHVLPYCHDGPSHPDIKAAVAALKPSVLIGISEGSQGITFCQDVCQRLATAHERPILMPLSLSGQPCQPPILRHHSFREMHSSVCAVADRVMRLA